MKRPLNLLAVLIKFITSGCNDYTIRTTINPDGSFERTIVCDGTSNAFSNFHLPYVIDSTWNVVAGREQGGEKRQITTAKKAYANSEQLMAEFARGRDTSKLQVACRVEKKFRWFFTYYFYAETLPSFALYRHEPVDSFFTPAEIRLMKEGSDSLLDKRAEELWSRNIVDEFVERLQAKARELNDPKLPASAISECKETLTEQILKGKDDKPEDIERVVEKALWPRPARKLRGAMDAIFTTITHELEREAELEVSYKNEVMMPCILVTSNSRKIEGNKVMWECRSNKYFDVVMSAESRRVNLWAVITTAVVCLGLVIGLVLPLFQRAKGIIN